MFTLRDDQRKLVDAADAALLRGGVPCVVAPTGAGKTVMLADLALRARARGERLLVVAHRGEIIEQLMTSLRRHLPRRTTFETIGAGSKARWDAEVTVAMVPTLARRLKPLAALSGCTMLMDECHHAGSSTWGAVAAAARPARRAGFTATPVRPNGKGLGDEGGFTELLIGPQPGELIEDGHLARYRMFAAPRQIDVKGVRKTGGDFNLADLEKRVVEINGCIVPDWMRFNPDRHRTIVVGVNVEHAHALAQLYNEAGVAAAAVDGTTAKGARAAIFNRFRRGELTVLAACAVIDEGLDVPEATCLQITRPTASIRLYRQLVGRVLRPSPGKTEALIIDHTDNWKRLPPPNAAIDWTLNAEEQKPRERRELEADELGEVREKQITEVATTGVELVEVTAELLERSTPAKARRLLNERAMAEIRGGNAAVLRPWLQRTAVLEEATLAALGQALGMPPNWARTQAMLNGWKAPLRRNAETRLAAASYGR